MSSRGQPIDHLVIAVPNLAAAAARYEALGFTLTPRASHPEAMGTANRLAQFAGHNFIELLEVDRPARLVGHDLKAAPPRFSFGAFNRDYLKAGAGLSMLVLAGRDNAADVARFAAAGLKTYAPFDFGRRATLPNGSEVEVAFSLAFATDPAMPRAAFFTCHNRFPENFWKPAFQDHANGARRIAATYMIAAQPARHAAFLEGFTGSGAEQIEGGLLLPCGPHELIVLTPAAIAQLSPRAAETPGGPQLIGFAVEGPDIEPHVTQPDDACGAFIEWRRGGQEVGPTL
jgi:hypothetical protein